MYIKVGDALPLQSDVSHTQAEPQKMDAQDEFPGEAGHSSRIPCQTSGVQGVLPTAIEPSYPLFEAI